MSPFAARARAWLFVVRRSRRAASPCTSPAAAFCGFYVGKADAGLFNEASQVILVRREGKTVISMANDYRGALTEFALVVPVPQVLEREPDPHRRPQALRAHRRVQRAAPRRVLRSRSLCGRKVARAMGARRRAAAGVASRRRKRDATRRWASPSRRLHRRRIRHRDAVGEAVGRARDLAARERLPDPEGRERGAQALHPPEHEVLRREGEPQGAGEDRRRLPAAAAVRVRVAEVHAAGAPRHAERATARRISCSTC